MTSAPVETERPFDAGGFLRQLLGVALFCGLVVVVVRAAYLAVTESDRYPLVGNPDVWMPTATAAGVGVVALLVAAFVLRSWRRGPGITQPHAMQIFGAVAALAFGALLGFGGAAATTKAVGYVEDHTPAANAARAHAKAFEAAYQRSPVVNVPSQGPPAPAAAARRMIAAGDLGPGWYSMSSGVRTHLPAAQGATSEYRAWLTQQHRVANGWHLDGGILESAYVTPSPAAARAFAAKLPTSTLGRPVPRATRRVIGGAVVNTWAPSTYRSAPGLASIFVEGNWVWELRYWDHQDPASSGPQTAQHVLSLAVRRAVGGR
jgi:hypothetical protein